VSSLRRSGAGCTDPLISAAMKRICAVTGTPFGAPVFPEFNPMPSDSPSRSSMPLGGCVA
jgi:hypothetical protein